MYKMMTAKEVIDRLWDRVGLNRKVDFTFDNIEVCPEREPSGWYGVKLLTPFDETDELLAFGYYGGGATRVYHVNSILDGDSSEEAIKLACAKRLQMYMDEMCEWNGKCEKVCVEIEEEK